MYRIEFSQKAQDQLKRLDKVVAQRVLDKLAWLKENIDDVMPQGLTRDWRGKNKLRVGDYRIVYTIEKAEQVILVRLIDHRSRVYKRRLG